MKRIVIIAFALAMVAGIGVGSASAANSLQQGNLSIGVGMGDSIFSHKTVPAANSIVNDVVDINARYLVTKDLAIIGGFGLQVDGGDADATYFSFTAGVRKYLKTDDFAPFVGGQLTYAAVTAKEGNPSVKTVDLSVIDLSAVVGAEYFVGKQFSLEGSVGVGFGQARNKLTDVDDTYFGTRTVGVRANYYF
jgi:Outer membrane protein beta-barrel domain